MSPALSSLLIRDATAADGAAVAEIYNESIAAGDCTMDDAPKSAEEMAELIRGFSEREVILILEDDADGQVLGWGIIKKYSDRPGYRFACETSVYLRRELTGRGFGPRVKRALLDRCRQFGYHHLVAKVWADNERSIAYNRNFGYEVVGIQKEIGHMNGRWQDVAILQLVLEEDGEPPDEAGES